MEALWQEGKSLVEAAAELRPTFNLTVHMVAQRFYKKYPRGCWPGRRIFDFQEPKIGDSIESLTERSTPYTAEEMQLKHFKLRTKFDFDLISRRDWVVNRVKQLNPDLVDLLDSLLGNHGHMFHVSPPAPGASLCLCIS